MGKFLIMRRRDLYLFFIPDYYSNQDVLRNVLREWSTQKKFLLIFISGGLFVCTDFVSRVSEE